VAQHLHKILWAGFIPKMERGKGGSKPVDAEVFNA
jgi:hypothetical protein